MGAMKQARSFIVSALCERGAFGRGVVAVAVVAAAMLSTMPPGASTASAATVVNGNFETGTLSGWTVDDVGDGRWFNYTGTTSPQSGFTIDPPPEGNRAAVTDQDGPGRHILYQDVALEPNFDHTLSLILYYRNQNVAFRAPPHLDPFGEPNQQYRIDIMKPSAPVDSVASGNVLLNVFRTLPGDPLTKAPTTTTADLSPFAGQTVRIRFAEVDNQFYFQASVDAVSIESVPRNEPPDCSQAEPSVGTLWPPNHKMRAVTITGVTDPDGDPVTITITSIGQDEPTKSPGSGNTAPDGSGVGSDTAFVRAERDGRGDGRVYHIGLSAADGQGGTCTGEVIVGVPHSKKSTAVDGGPLFDSRRRTR
jgi:HpiC1 cyclase